MAQPWLQAGRSHLLHHAPRLALPAFGVYREAEKEGLPAEALDVFAGMKLV